MDGLAVTVSAPYPSEQNSTPVQLDILPTQFPLDELYDAFPRLVAQEKPIDWENFQPIEQLYPFLNEIHSPDWDEYMRGLLAGIDSTLPNAPDSSMMNHSDESPRLSQDGAHELAIPGLDATADDLVHYFQLKGTSTPPAFDNATTLPDVPSRDLRPSNDLPAHETGLNDDAFDVFNDYNVDQSLEYQNFYQDTYDAASYLDPQATIDPPAPDYSLDSLLHQSVYPPLSIAAEPVPAYGNQFDQSGWLTQNSYNGGNQYLSSCGAWGPAFDNSSMIDPSLFPTSSSYMQPNSVPLPTSTRAPTSHPDVQARPTNRRPAPRDLTDQYSIPEELVNADRSSKKRRDASCNPRHYYTAPIPVPAPWGPTLKDGRPAFIYGDEGQLASDRVYSADQIRQYAKSGKATFWIQNAPAQCNNRMSSDDRRCRWDQCPCSGKLVSAGWLRVAMDEFAMETSNGTKDPFKVAGVMHLWCLEQCLDIVELHSQGRLLPENRAFPKEVKNSMSLERDRDRNIVHDTYEPWFEERVAYQQAHGAEQMPRRHADSLSCALIQKHLDNQTPTRQRARSKRNQKKPEDAHKTIDVHRGDLGLFAQIHKQAGRRGDSPSVPTSLVATPRQVDMYEERPVQQVVASEESAAQSISDVDYDSLFDDWDDIVDFTAQGAEADTRGGSASLKRKRSDVEESDNKGGSKRNAHSSNGAETSQPSSGQDRGQAANVPKLDTYMTRSGFHFPMAQSATRSATRSTARSTFSPRRSPRRHSPRKFFF